jgi:hypothetical protein
MGRMKAVASTVEERTVAPTAKRSIFMGIGTTKSQPTGRGKRLTSESLMSHLNKVEIKGV